jgi:putative tryptophan/tyrosine transport system substrate-binding protein
MAHWWQMRRREFITLVGGVAATWPLAARAQQPAMPVIGFLHSSSPEPNANRVSAFRKGLAETGYVEGQNLAIEFRWAEGQDDRLPDLAADLIRRRVAVIATPASTPASLAAQAATTSIPIVFAVAADPVALRLVASLNRPGGNATGVSFQFVELLPKQLGMLRELAPGANRFVALVSRNSAFTDTVVKDLQASASVIGVPIDIFRVGTGREIDAAFANLVQKPGGALLVVSDPFFTNRRAQIVTLAARHALPAIYYAPEFAEIGGLMSYGPNVADGYRQAGIYVGRILKGEKPADLPVVQPTKFELVVNLNTARALGITIPNTLLALADEVIE